MATERVILQADAPLSRSLLWDVQRRYFARAGVAAWRDDVVPHQISCSPLMARAYAQTILGYLRDCAAAGVLDRKRPFHIIELGAGSGRLTYHLMHQLLPLLDASPFANVPLTFVLTDFAPSLLEFWQTHPKLRHWVNAGRLDFGYFDAVERRRLTLIHSGITLTPGTVHNPIVLLANYFFDSIPQDSFAIEDGQLCHNLHTLTSSQPETDLDDPTLWERVRIHFEPIPLPPAYEIAFYNEILAGYEATLPDGRFTFPNVGLDVVRFWQGVANGRLLLLASDRGHTRLEDIVHEDDPAPNLHGSFSLMVNFHAIGAYARRSGGLALTATHYQNNIQTNAFLLSPPNGGMETALAFPALLGVDDLFGLRDPLAAQTVEMDLPQLLSLLRRYAHDADLFCDMYPVLCARIREAEPVWYVEVAAVATAVLEQHLSLGEESEVEAKVAALLKMME